MSDNDEVDNPDRRQNYDGFSEIQACFLYIPTTVPDIQRPKKRRKISHAVKEINNGQLFVPLLGGEETLENVSLRRKLNEDIWADQASVLETIPQKVHAETALAVVEFIINIPNVQNDNFIPTGLIAVGIGATASGSMFTSISRGLKSNREILFIDIAVTQCPNLKTALKYVVRQAADQVAPTEDMGIRLLGYDLESLYEIVRRHSIHRVVLYFRSSESLDGLVLADLICILSSWVERIPFGLLFEVATSVDLFQEKLPQAAIRYLQGTLFKTRDAVETLELMFRAATDPMQERPFWIGPSLFKMILERLSEHYQSAFAFIQALKYVHMTHFFVNPLSVMLSGQSSFAQLQDEHVEAIRNLPSFRTSVDYLLENKEFAKVKRLLDDNDYVRLEAYTMLKEGWASLRNLLSALEIYDQIQSCLSIKGNLSWSKLYNLGMSGELTDSSNVREMLISVRKTPSDNMMNMLSKISCQATLRLDDVRSDLESLIGTLDGKNTTLHSEYDVHHETLRTTVVSQKVQLSKHKAALSKQDAEYSKIVDRVNLTLKEFFAKYLINPKDLVLHEIFLFDLKSPCRDVFAPRPRHVVERALSAPHDYLACDCCDPNENTLSSTQPATAILYQLYLESGSIINISDLWSAFQTILEPEQKDDEEGREVQLLALFYRSLAELNYLGMIKSSRKKADHLNKLAWKGL